MNHSICYIRSGSRISRNFLSMEINVNCTAAMNFWSIKFLRIVPFNGHQSVFVWFNNLMHIKEAIVVRCNKMLWPYSLPPLVHAFINLSTYHLFIGCILASNTNHVTSNIQSLFTQGLLCCQKLLFNFLIVWQSVYTMTISERSMLTTFDIYIFINLLTNSDSNVHNICLLPYASHT